MLLRTAYWSIQWTLEIMEAGKWSWIFYFILLLHIFFWNVIYYSHSTQSENLWTLLPIRSLVKVNQLVSSRDILAIIREKEEQQGKP